MPLRCWGDGMTDDRPDPMVPPDVDLRDFAFMPLDIIRLFGSRFHAIASDAEWRAGVTLWCRSWHQVPAASLPDDDVELCRLAELGRDLKTWKALRAGALHGWVLCSDGRLYHSVVADKARDAWDRKQKQRERSRKGNAKRWGRPEGQAAGVAAGSVSTATGIPEGSTEDPKGQGQGQGQGQGERDNDDDLHRSRVRDPSSSSSSSDDPEPIDPDRVVPIRSAADRFDPGEPTDAGVIAAWLIQAERAAGRQATGVTSMHPGIQSWVSAKVPHREIAEAYRVATEQRSKAGDRSPIGPSYIDAVLRGLRERATTATSPMPAAPGRPEPAAWEASDVTMLAEADRCGIRVNGDWTIDELRWHIRQHHRRGSAA
jgi:hypothetical protein